MSEFLAEIIRYNPNIARGLKTLRRRAIAFIEQAAIADTVLDARTAHNNRASFHASQISSVRSGLTATPELDGSMRAAIGLRDMLAPDAMSHKPLAELELLALRTEQVLRKRQSRDRGLGIGVALVEGALLGLAGFMVLYGDYLYAGIVFVVAVLVTVVVRLVWNPFARGSRVAHLIGLANALSSDISVRMAAIDKIDEHATRQLTQWKAVEELTEGIPELS